jgi:hypothetical protein
MLSWQKPYPAPAGHNLFQKSIFFSPSSARAQSLDKAFEFAKTCEGMDDQLFSCKMILGFIYGLKKEYDRAFLKGGTQ